MSASMLHRATLPRPTPTLARRRCGGRRAAATPVASADLGQARTGPAAVAERLGFDLSDGIFGYTPFAELWTGRLAMAGFLVGAVEERITGNGILAQIGVETPSNEVFTFLAAFSSLVTLAGVAGTVVAAQNGTLRPKLAEGYKSFFGLGDEAEQARVAAAKGLKQKPTGLFGLPRVTEEAFEYDDEPDMALTPDLFPTELVNARVAMLGFAGVVLIESASGYGIFPQLIAIGKSLGVFPLGTLEL